MKIKLTYYLFAILFIPLVLWSQVDQSREKSLKDLSIQRTKLIQELEAKEKELDSNLSNVRETELNNQVEDLRKHIQNLDDSFILIASGNDPRSIRDTNEVENFKIDTELLQLLRPLIVQLRRITEQPRQIHTLQSAIERYKILIAQLTTVLKNLEETKQQISDDLVKQEISQKIEELDLQLETSTSSLGVSQEKLNQILSSRKSFAESIANVFEIFFKSRARNLLYAVLITLIFCLVVRKLYSITQGYLNIESKVAATPVRMISLIFLLVSSFGSAAVFLFCLFVFSDWLLLILGTLVVIGLFWASRQALPRVWHQAALLLNLGPVREGERVVVNGISMLVQHIRLFTVLVNPLLQNGRLLLPLADLVGMRSRAVDDNENWFITKTGDWVLIDNVLSQVTYQGLEYVEVQHLGGAKKYFNPVDFSSAVSKVLSSGFRISLDFGVDYEHQANATVDIPEIFRTELLDYFTKYKIISELKTLRVEFKLANASSLDFVVLADFTGSLAARYEELHRMIQKSLVESCNRHSWLIPFQQIDLHIRKQHEA